MQTHYHRLITLLDAEADFYQDLLACVQNEKQAIVEMDFDRLGELGSLKEQMLLKQHEFAQARDRTLKEICDNSAESCGLPTLSELSQQAPSPYSQALQRRRRRLRDLVASLSVENDHVKQLVHHGLALVRGSYQLMTQLLDVNPVYHSTGNLTPAAPTGKFHQGDY
jgi:flagellar biosynthesis/type III secretory pathway chaperone